MMRLAWDMCRCVGAGCEMQKRCARHEQLNNMGPRTPVMDRCCDERSPYGEFIPVAEERKEPQ